MPPPLPWSPNAGARVRRNPNYWVWGSQDGAGEGILVEGDIGSNGWVTVRWEKTGTTEKYRWGAEGAYDIEPVAGTLRLKGEVVVPCQEDTQLNNRSRGIFRDTAKRDLSVSFEVPLGSIEIPFVSRESEGPPGIAIGFILEAPTNDMVYQLEAAGKSMIERRELRMQNSIRALNDEEDVEFSGSDCLWNSCWVESERIRTAKGRAASVPQAKQPFSEADVVPPPAMPLAVLDPAAVAAVTQQQQQQQQLQPPRPCLRASQCTRTRLCSSSRPTTTPAQRRRSPRLPSARSHPPVPRSRPPRRRACRWWRRHLCRRRCRWRW